MPRYAAMLFWTFLLLAGLGLSEAFGDPQDDAFRKELKAIAGTWRPVYAENSGNRSSEESLKEIRWIRDANGTWAMHRGDNTLLEWTVRKIDATKKPKTIDIEITAGPHKGVVYRGIYELEGDTLRICFAMPENPERPMEFSADKGSRRALSVFKRERLHDL